MFASVHANKNYDGNKSDVSRLHLCAWANAFVHSSSGQNLQSNDQFVIGAGHLRKGVEYIFEIVALQYDTAVYDAAFDALNQFHIGATSRRMLSVDEQLETEETAQQPSFPVASIKKRAMLKQFAASRKTLSVLMPVQDVMSTTALMPQGPPQYSAPDPQTPIITAGSGGFLITGPAVSQSGTPTEAPTAAPTAAPTEASSSEISRYEELTTKFDVMDLAETFKDFFSSDIMDVFEYAGFKMNFEFWEHSEYYFSNAHLRTVFVLWVFAAAAYALLAIVLAFKPDRDNECRDSVFGIYSRPRFNRYQFYAFPEFGSKETQINCVQLKCPKIIFMVLREAVCIFTGTYIIIVVWGLVYRIFNLFYDNVCCGETKMRDNIKEYIHREKDGKMSELSLGVKFYLRLAQFFAFVVDFESIAVVSNKTVRDKEKDQNGPFGIVFKFLFSVSLRLF